MNIILTMVILPFTVNAIFEWVIKPYIKNHGKRKNQKIIKELRYALYHSKYSEVQKSAMLNFTFFIILFIAVSLIAFILFIMNFNGSLITLMNDDEFKIRVIWNI